MLRIKTKTKKGKVATYYYNGTWFSFLFTDELHVHGANKTLEADSLLGAGDNHLLLCKELL